MSLAYDEYLSEHISNVSKGLNWMLDNLPLTQEEKEAIDVALSHEHDYSKNSTAEYNPYDQYFYSGNQSYAVKLAFDYAWLHHIHNNPHHWQYWVLLEDDPETGVPFKALQIPIAYIFEMVADWWTFSWKNNNLFEIFNWYADHRHKQYIHPESRAMLENILKKIWNVLVMQEAVAGHDVTEIEAQYMRVWLEEDVDLLNWDHPSTQVIGKVVDTRETKNGLEVTVEEEPKVELVEYEPNIDDDESYDEAVVIMESVDGRHLYKLQNIDPGDPNGDATRLIEIKPAGHAESSAKDTALLEYVPNLDDDEAYDEAVVIMESVDGRHLYKLQNKVEHSDTEDSNEGLYGIPEVKKYPMPDKKHVKLAIRFFNYVDPKYEKELADAILEKAKEFGLNLEEDMTVGDDNRFKKYLKKEES